jgi:MoxR-like ATPase
MVQLNLGYPSFANEVEILEREEHEDPLNRVKAVISPETIVELQAAARAVDVVRPLKEYIVQVVTATRIHPDVMVGVSPRGGVSLQRLAQGLAALRGRTYVTPDDIKAAAPAAQTHRRPFVKPTLISIAAKFERCRAVSW